MSNVFVSSCCIKIDNITTAVETLVREGVRHIELSGGTNYIKDIKEKLISLKNKHNVNFICHNYFPPPKQPFVLNLASLNKEIFDQSIEHAITAIELSKQLNAQYYSIHAGFLLDITTNEIGKQVAHRELQNRDQSIEQFVKAINIINQETDNFPIYIENNVLSFNNYKEFNNHNPFLLTCWDDYKELRSLIKFKCLLDVGHLKVTCHSLGLNFKEELALFMDIAEYIHISDNNNISDQNRPLVKNSQMYSLLKGYDWSNKIVTIEVYDNIENVLSSYNCMKDIIL